MDSNTLVTNVANDDDDEPPSMDNDGVTQTQHHTTLQHNDTMPPNQVGPLVPQPSLPTTHAGTLPFISPPIAHTSYQQDHS